MLAGSAIARIADTDRPEVRIAAVRNLARVSRRDDSVSSRSRRDGRQRGRT
jgi:hypothetical protein